MVREEGVRLPGRAGVIALAIAGLCVGCASGSGSAGAACPSGDAALSSAQLENMRPAMPRAGNPIVHWTGAPASATVEFVVDSAGRVEPTTAQVLAASDSAYADSVRAILPRLRFSPARLASGCLVATRVQFPFESPPAAKAKPSIY